MLYEYNRTVQNNTKQNCTPAPKSVRRSKYHSPPLSCQKSSLLNRQLYLPTDATVWPCSSRVYWDKNRSRYDHYYCSTVVRVLLYCCEENFHSSQQQVWCTIPQYKIQNTKCQMQTCIVMLGECCANPFLILHSFKRKAR